MDKIKELLAKSGVKPELIGAICESLDQYANDVQTNLQAEYAKKVEKAKQICVEEANLYKQTLARRVQIFCESKSATIERKLLQNSAIKESEAVTKLNNIKSLVEGIELDGAKNGSLKSGQWEKQIADLTKLNKSITEKAARQAQVAESALKRTRTLENTISEMKKVSERKVIAESQSRTGRQPLKSDRGQPTTTRRTLAESQIRRNVQPRQHAITPDEIASQLDD